uniref:SHSP domain-containing protein n=1 Tax=Kalanchoe fedtschenkoi TaxID=63787 RepID=A0A7N0TZV3_KALFE
MSSPPPRLPIIILCPHPPRIKSLHCHLYSTIKLKPKQQSATRNISILLHSSCAQFTEMAASLALKRAASSPLFSRLLNPARPAQLSPAASRWFNTNTQMTRYDDSEESGLEVDQRDRAVSGRRRGDVPSIFSDVLDPFSPTRSLSQVLNMMDQFMDNPFLAASRGMGTGAARRGWDVKEDNNGLYLRMDMPGLDRQNVKVSVEQNTLVIKGEGEQEGEDEESKRRYSSRIELPPNLYKLDGIKAEMKNGVLKVVVPKVKEEERTDVHHVQIE